MKYSDKMIERVAQLGNERKLFKEMIEKAPSCQLMSYLNDICEQLKEHPDLIDQEVAGLVVGSIIIFIGEDDQ